jgi:hypothetical protein
MRYVILRKNVLGRHFEGREESRFAFKFALRKKRNRREIPRLAEGRSLRDDNVKQKKMTKPNSTANADPSTAFGMTT